MPQVLTSDQLKRLSALGRVSAPDTEKKVRVEKNEVAEQLAAVASRMEAVAKAIAQASTQPGNADALGSLGSAVEANNEALTKILQLLSERGKESWRFTVVERDEKGRFKVLDATQR